MLLRDTSVPQSSTLGCFHLSGQVMFLHFEAGEIALRFSSHVLCVFFTCELGNLMALSAFLQEMCLLIKKYLCYVGTFILMVTVFIVIF